MPRYARTGYACTLDTISSSEGGEKRCQPPKIVAAAAAAAAAGAAAAAAGYLPQHYSTRSSGRPQAPVLALTSPSRAEILEGMQRMG